MAPDTGIEVGLWQESYKTNSASRMPYLPCRRKALNKAVAKGGTFARSQPGMYTQAEYLSKELSTAS